MKQSSLFLFLTLLSCVLVAQAPRTWNYQGFLTTDGTTPIADGIYDITFTIYNAASAGTNLWSENQATVSVTNGDFVVDLPSFENLGVSSIIWMIKITKRRVIVKV